MPKYSQNFLTNDTVAAKIVSALKEKDFDCLVEIGPGKGFLTRRLIETFGSDFTVIEIDSAMVALLKENIPLQKLPKIVNCDFLKLNLDKTLPHKKICFVGNLPYAAANAILRKVLEFKGFGCGVFMFQKEVAERILAKAGQKAYSALSLLVQSKVKVHRVANVDKKYFRPVPKVDSAVVGFDKLPCSFFTSETEERKFVAIVKSAFAYRRKTILNSLSMSLKLPRNETEILLKKAGIDPGVRPQDISLEGYLKLSNCAGVPRL
jgi:16S rRNA (adenine1518-N6/adenine1519-N6)-dimethyltransferase